MGKERYISPLLVPRLGNTLEPQKLLGGKTDLPHTSGVYSIDCNHINTFASLGVCFIIIKIDQKNPVYNWHFREILEKP